MVSDVFNIGDLIIAPILFVLMLTYIAFQKKYNNTPLKKHFIWGFIFKVLGCISFIIVYSFYYKGGDTFNYFYNVQGFRTLIFEDISNLKYLLKHKIPHTVSGHIENKSGIYTNFLRSKEEFPVVRFATFFSLFLFNSYLAISLTFAFFSFIGSWCIFRTVTILFNLKKNLIYIGLPILYFPSIWFWSSGLMKESIVMFFLGVFIYSFYQLFFEKRKVILNLIVTIFCFFMLLNIKEYIIIAFSPALLLWSILSIVNKADPIVKLIARPFLFIASISLIALALPYLSSISERYALEEVLSTAQRTSTYLYKVSKETGGSFYSLGIVSYTPMGILKVVPKAIAVSLFRPYIFEAKNPVMIVSSLESMFFLFLTILVFFKVGILKFFRLTNKHPFLLGCFTFSLIFAFAVGLSTSNFGSLVRYRVPCLPFYGFSLLIPLFLNGKK